MPKLIKIILVLFIAFLAGVFFRSLYQDTISSHTTAALPAPNFTAPILTGDESMLEQQELSKESLYGQYSIINFFASWCAPCLVEHPLVKELSTISNLTVYGIAHLDQPQAVQQWLEKNGNPYKAVALSLDGQAGISWGLKGVPETFLISPTGEILYHRRGILQKKDIEKIASLIP